MSYCKTCGAGRREYMECEAPDCEIVSDVSDGLTEEEIDGLREVLRDALEKAEGTRP